LKNNIKKQPIVQKVQVNIIEGFLPQLSPIVEKRVKPKKEPKKG